MRRAFGGQNFAIMPFRMEMHLGEMRIHASFPQPQQFVK